MSVFQCLQLGSMSRLKKKTYQLALKITDVKHVEEAVVFLSNHEQEAMERTRKRSTNGSDMTIPRATRKSFVIAFESLTSLANTRTEPHRM